MCESENKIGDKLYRYKQEYQRKLLRKRNLSERRQKLMPEDFRFSPILRNDEKERFLVCEEEVKESLKNTFESKISFKKRLGTILVEITTTDGEVIKDIIRLDNVNYNYCVGLIKLALGVKENVKQ